MREVAKLRKHLVKRRNLKKKHKDDDKLLTKILISFLNDSFK